MSRYVPCGADDTTSHQAPPSGDDKGDDFQTRLATVLGRVAAHAQQSVRRFLDEVEQNPDWQATARETSELLKVGGIGETLGALSNQLDTDPELLARAQMRYWRDGFRLMIYFNHRCAGMAATPVIEPGPGDRRFSDPAWRDNPLFDVIKQHYLLYARWLMELLDGVQGLDIASQRKANFVVRQMIDAMAPTNALMSNPQALRETLNSNGENLIRGLEMYLDDLKRGHGRLAVRTSNEDDFEIGSSVATTPGKVVFKNDMIELIQYQPSTPKVHKVPLLIIPPWINKYYVLDLRAENSFIKWAVDQGVSVFVISWVNPDINMADKGFDDYMTDGPLAALIAVEKATGEKQINTLGYCIGGTLLAAALAYLNLKGDKRVKSATFLTSLLDFSDVGDVSIFLDDAHMKVLDRHMADKGILEGREMTAAFAVMRAKDTIWPFAINNYLLGRKPPPFDILFWNADNTNMPAKMHSFYLRNMYLENRLRVPGGISLGGTPIDLSQISQPTYFMAARDDHIAPWTSVFAGSKLVKGPVRFVLAKSGHVSGVVNPPQQNKYAHWVADHNQGEHTQWIENATEHPGSWWTDWATWIAKHSGSNNHPPRIPGSGELKAICDAPGTYVLKKS